MRTSNPMMKDNVFTRSLAGVEAMTLQGAVNKTITLLALVVIGAGYTWNLFYNQGAAAVQPWMIGGLVGGFVVAMVTIFRQTWAPVLAPAYAVLEGLALGGISAFFFCLLIAYKSRLIKVTENFRLGVVAATGGIALVYMIGFVGSFFGWQMPYIHESGIIGIGFSLFVVVIASMNLVLDFDFIERGHGVAPKYMEWYAAFGLIVTLVWLYLEILRLLSKLRER
jgi:uncharacterized YccA/Bax inhibitor family protein